MAQIFVTNSGNDSTGDGSSGNPYATLGKAMAVALLAGPPWSIEWKKGTYPVTTTSANVSGGIVNITSGPSTETDLCVVRGFNSTPGDLDGVAPTTSNAPVLQASGITGSSYLFNVNAHRVSARGFIIDGQSLGTISGLTNPFASRIENIWVKNACVGVSAPGYFSNRLRASNCADKGLYGGPFLFSVAHNCNRGFYHGSSPSGFSFGCLAYDNTIEGFYSNIADGGCWANCVSDGNGGAGFLSDSTNLYNTLYLNCLSTNNVYGFDSAGSSGTARLLNCASYLNSSGRARNFSNDDLPITCLVDPYADRTLKNFLPNTAPTGGALLRALGLPSVLANMSIFYDVGLQHQDAGGSTLVLVAEDD